MPQTHMLREMVEAIEALTAQRALIVWLEDLQWSDAATLEWLSAFAWRQEYARLLVLGTCRPLEALEHDHPLRAIMQELAQHRYSAELCLKGLSEADIARYLAYRLNNRVPPALQTLAATIRRRTEGNPLFVVNLADHLLARGILGEAAGNLDDQKVEETIPETLQQMIERQLDRLDPEEQRVLEVASVARAEFSAAAVAAGAETALEEIEQRCAALARHGLFLQASGLAEWPDGTVAARYRFRYSLYQQVLYERVPPSWRIRLHRQIGERKEAGYGEHTGEIAVELAVHFARGRDYRRAIHYLRQAGQNAMRQSAHTVQGRKPRHVFARLLRLPARNRRNGGNYEPRSASPASGGGKTIRSKLTGCWRKSMAGSPKDSTRPISKRPRSCWRSVTVSEDTGLRYADGAVDFGNRSDE